MPLPDKATATARGWNPLIDGVDPAFAGHRADTSVRSAQYKVLRILPIAGGATFDSQADEYKARCLEHTRTDLLREITSWAQDPNAPTVHWLNGLAGTGKPTISRTIAHTFSESNTLGDRFFFNRGAGDHGGTTKFIPTLPANWSSEFLRLPPMWKAPSTKIRPFFPRRYGSGLQPDRRPPFQMLAHCTR
jgi:hypothetical protein